MGGLKEVPEVGSYLLASSSERRKRADARTAEDFCLRAKQSKAEQILVYCLSPKVQCGNIAH